MEDFPGYDSNRKFAEHERQMRDLADVLATPQGFRVICDILTSLGAGRYMANEAGAVALYNEAERLLRTAARADAGATVRLMAAIRGIELQ